jgi:glutathione synthase/RimK-type ligase-like ATP-grasp enzyme
VLLIGSARGRRTPLLEAAAGRVGLPIEVIDWRDLLRDESSIERRLGSVRTRHVWCKIDPPSDDPQTVDALIRRGFEASDDGLPAPHPLRRGELAFMQWWHAGFMSLLKRIESQLDGLRLFTSVEHIKTMCDKLACQRHLCRRVDLPLLLGEVTSFEAFEAQWPADELPAVFIKPRYGSSAAGVIALRRHRDGHIRAYSSARFGGDGSLYSHRKIAAYSEREQVAPLVDALAAQGAYAERWIPKPRAPGAGASYDVRVVTFCGRPRQRIARISSSPMTNLHLGNRRAAPQWLTERQVSILEDTVAAAASAFDESLTIGFDVVPQATRAYVLEANAFGDLLPGLEFDGASTFDDQVRRVRRDEH